MDTVIIRVGSGRARHSIYSAIGKQHTAGLYCHEELFSHHRGHREYMQIPAVCFDSVRHIRGVTLARTTGKTFCQCWQ